jgi:hypothetical protein
MPGPKTGHKMKAYRNTGTVAIPVWSEVADIGDLNIPDFAMGLAELKRRSKKWTKNLATLIQSVAVEFRFIHGLDSTNFNAMRTNHLDGIAEEWAIMDGAIATQNSAGWRIPVLVENFPWDQNLEDVSGHDIRLAIAYFESPAGTEVDPSWYIVP